MTRPILRVTLSLFVTLLFQLVPQAAYADGFDNCRVHLPFGIPVPADTARTTPVCHDGYAALVDDEHRVPRWVAYDLTAQHSLGCIKRTNNFHAELQIPASLRAEPTDYVHSGYDRGHHAPAEDFAWNLAEMKDSFSMANMAPQLHSLNAGVWEKGENDVRAWALERGEVLIYVGSIISDTDKVIGDDRVDVPASFWKVVIDPARHQAIAWIMPQDAPASSDVERWVRSITDIEAAVGLRLPLPEGTDDNVSAMWPVDLQTWNEQRAAACPLSNRR